MNINNQKLFDASARGDLIEVRELLEIGVCDPNFIVKETDHNPYGFAARTVLGAAAQSGNLSLVQLLLEKGAKVCPIKLESEADVRADAIAAFIFNRDSEKVNYDIFKALLSKARNYGSRYVTFHSPYFIMRGSIGDLFAMLRGNKDLHPFISIKWLPRTILKSTTPLSHYFCESVVRNNYEEIARLSQQGTVGPIHQSLTFTADIWETYLEGRAFLPVEASLANDGIDFLASTGILGDHPTMLVQQLKHSVVKKITVEENPHARIDALQGRITKMEGDLQRAEKKVVELTTLLKQALDSKK